MKLFLYEYDQNDRKVDSGVRLVQRNLAIQLRHGDPFRGILLDPFAPLMLSPSDESLIERKGLGAINCSWNGFEKIPAKRASKANCGRRLPFLLAANSVNYGKPSKLNTAEALAAALFITGFVDEAEQICEQFSWGDEFKKINSEFLLEYASCEDSNAVKLADESFLRRRSVSAEKVRSSKYVPDAPTVSVATGESDTDGSY